MTTKRRLAYGLTAAGAAAALAVGGAAVAHAGPAAPTEAKPMAKLSQGQAEAKFQSAGITWSSSGGCSDRNTPTCTSFDQINSETVDGAITLKSASNCAVKITGGTETGHASGTYSHWNGYKVDIHPTSCLDTYIKGTFTSIGGSKWQSGSGNVYYREGDHWDVTYHNCGC